MRICVLFVYIIQLTNKNRKMASFTEAGSKQKGDLRAVPSGPATAAECGPDVVRYRNLARELAAQRKMGQRQRSEGCAEDASATSILQHPPTSPPAEGRTAPARRRFSVGTISAVFLLVAGGLACLLVNNGDPAQGEASEPMQKFPLEKSVQPTQSGMANATEATELLLPLETAVIANAAQNQALDDLRHRLQAAEAMSATYASLLVQERAHSRVLEEQLASAQSSASMPESSGAPSLADLGAPERPSVPARPEPPAFAPEAAIDRLMARAAQLREQGNIAAARAILENCVEGGGGVPLFALAETYDPALLSVWRTFGTKPDIAKARELYRAAEAAGIIEATERLKSLPE